VHQLLRNASDIDASASEAPGRSDRRRLNEVTKADLLAKVGGLLGSRKAAGSASDDLQSRNLGEDKGRWSRGGTSPVF